MNMEELQASGKKKKSHNLLALRHSFLHQDRGYQHAVLAVAAILIWSRTTT